MRQMCTRKKIQIPPLKGKNKWAQGLRRSARFCSSNEGPKWPIGLSGLTSSHKLSSLCGFDSRKWQCGGPVSI